MALSRFQRQSLFSDLALVLLSGILGACFSAIMMSIYQESPFGPEGIRYLALGFITGLGISSTTFAQQRFFARWQPLPFWFVFLVYPLILTVQIVVVYSAIFIALFGIQSYLTESWILQTIGITFLFTTVINFINTLSRILGKNVLRGLLLGTYHKPVKENRFVMFLDIAGSTSIAETIGDLGFHALLNDFFRDISEPIVNCRGEIYKYMGDEAIITWKERTGAKNLAALEVFFLIENAIENKKDRYLASYGIVPEFRAGLHYGPLVVGEIGLNKQEIAFSGDVMNTTARIQAECRVVGERFLVSEDALSRLLGKERTGVLDSTGMGLEIRSHGAAALRGKTKEIGISAVRRTQA
jgi:class 3 adenylate cyclase